MQITEAALGGLRMAETRLNKAASALAPAVSLDSPAGVDSVDLSAAMLELIQARTEAASSVKAFQTATEMQQSTLSLLA